MKAGADCTANQVQNLAEESKNTSREAASLALMALGLALGGGLRNLPPLAPERSRQP